MRPVLFALCRLAWIFVPILGISGCATAKYRLADPQVPPPVPFNAKATSELPPVTVVLHTVIVYKGPGSWKKEAYWDEYAVTVINRGSEPLTLDRAVIIDAYDQGRVAGADPWLLEKSSQRILRDYRQSKREILLGVGLATTWLASGGAAMAGLYGGSATAGLIGAYTVVAIPVWLIGRAVLNTVARQDVQDEFHRRRLPLPAVLQPGAERSGSLFFPVAPGPRHLRLRFVAADGSTREIGIDLSPLANLHLKPIPADKNPAAPGKS